MCTDQYSLKYLLEQQITMLAQVRWLPKLMSFEYTIEYKMGRENQSVDALLRQVKLQCHTISVPYPIWWDNLKRDIQVDSYYSKFPSVA